MPDDAVAKAEFLLAVRDPMDAFLIRDQFAAYKVVNRVHAVHDAGAAVAYLDGAAPFTRRGRPDVVLLDLDLPGDGRNVLRHLRGDPATATVPVILLAGSPADEAVLRAHRHPVQGYATRPVGFDAIVSIIASLPGLGFEVLHNR